MKKALVIGIDDHPLQPLKCCVNDAREVAALLKFNADHSRNFDVELMTSPGDDISNWKLEQAVSRFFKSSVRIETAVFYFAGHGIISPQTDAGYIVGRDGRPGAWGMALSQLLMLAHEARATISSSVIILDCCHAGRLGDITGLSLGGASVIGPGMTILTSCNEDQVALEAGQHGVFTDLLLDGLRGGCADLRGNITPASIYSHIDQALGAHEQRPLYKANVQNFVTLRQVLPRIPAQVLRRLHVYFPDPDEEYRLAPTFEPDRENVPERFRHLPVNQDQVAVFKDLQKCNRQGLVVPVDADDMYSAAMNSKSCRLTPLGKHYRRLAENDKI